jgi:hypothetical protein
MFRGSLDSLEVAIASCNFQLYIISRQNVDTYLELIDNRIKEIAMQSDSEVEC